jgi:hypothetical protein
MIRIKQFRQKVNGEWVWKPRVASASDGEIESEDGVHAPSPGVKERIRKARERNEAAQAAQAGCPVAPADDSSDEHPRRHSDGKQDSAVLHPGKPKLGSPQPASELSGKADSTPAQPGLRRKNPTDQSEVFCELPVPERRHCEDEESAVNWNDFVFVPTYVTKTTGGGYAAILLARVIYWFTKMADGQPRLKPGTTLDVPRFWTPGYWGILKQTGIGKDKAYRAIRRLLRQQKKPVVIDKGSAGGLSYADRRNNRCIAMALSPRYAKFLDKEGRLDAGHKEPGVCAHVMDIALTKTANQAIVLSAILPWFEPNQDGKSKLRVKKDGYWWRANSHEQLSRETGLKLFQVKLAVKGLVLNHILIRKQYPFAGKNVLHVRINWEVLRQRRREVQEEDQVDGMAPED